MLQILEKEKSFTLIELIISIFILSIAIVGIFSAFSIMTILTSDTTDRLTATYLAQEGMEIIRNMRDTNWLNMDTCIADDISPCPYTWVDGLTDCNNGGCEVDYTTTGPGYDSIKPYTGDYLNIDTNGFYGYAYGTRTKFERKIIIMPITDVDNKSDHIIKVIAQVSWDEKATILNPGVKASTCGSYNCITADGTLYDWYNYVNQ